MNPPGRSVQAPSSVIMIRPHHFTVNTKTLADNAFQTPPQGLDPAAVARSAHAEVGEAARLRRAAGVEVHLFEDQSTATPDSVFPNNWLSTHPGGHVAIYPMFAPNRRRERRADVIEIGTGTSTAQSTAMLLPSPRTAALPRFRAF